MFLAGIQVDSEPDPRLKHSGVTLGDFFIALL